MDATHDPSRRSWVESANDGSTDFPVQNLPHGVFRRRETQEPWRGGVAIGDEVLDLSAACAAGVFEGIAADAAQAAAAPRLNDYMAMCRPLWRALRAELSRMLTAGAAERATLAGCLVPQAAVEHALPARIGDYTDFFTSRDHMLNMGRLFMPDRPELPNFVWLPIAYHGRASTVEVSGASFARPFGQHRPPGVPQPTFGPSTALDYELELCAWVGPGNRRGEPIGIDAAEDHLFGVGLLNDWSARDLQGWEAVPLGPFLAKNFLSTVSPWIVTMDALGPFRCAVRRDAGDPPWLPYLSASDGNRSGALDLRLEVLLQTSRSEGNTLPLSATRSRYSHWSFAQMVAHHTSNGCALAPGDLLGSGTQSGPGEREQGSLMELTRGGSVPVTLANGETRRMLEDGDTVVLRARAQRPGVVSIGFGECRGTVLPAVPA